MVFISVCSHVHKIQLYFYLFKKKCFICLYDPMQWTTLTRNNVFSGLVNIFATVDGSTFNGSVMATHGGSFESVNSIEVRKEYKRKAREEVIQKVHMCAL